MGSSSRPCSPPVARGRWLAASLLAIACFVSGRLSVAAAVKPAAAKAACAEARGSGANLAGILLPAQPEGTPRPKVPKRRIHTPPLQLVTTADDHAAETLRRYEEEQARDLVGLLRARVRQSAFSLGAQADPESILMQQNDYLEGWVEGIVRTAPTLADDLAAEVESALCDPETQAGESMLYARLGRLMPEVTSPAAFECALARHTQEDAVLWELLDALGASGLPAPKALDAVARNARDDRTLRRLDAVRSQGGVAASVEAATPVAATP
jgi:hypothetical protein